MKTFPGLVTTLIGCAALGGCALDPNPAAGPPEARDLRSPGSEVIAELHPDDDTTITFLRDAPSEGADGDESIDVTIHGRDGGRDYGALISEHGATPLEMFLALSGPKAPVPEPLQRAHERSAARLRAGDTSVRPLAPQAVALSPNGQELFGLSTFTCLSWDNFNSHLNDNVLGGGPGREIQTDASSYAHEILSPSVGAWVPGYDADLYVCNYNSAGNTPDSILGSLCHQNDFLGTPFQCNGRELADGWYLRRLYTGTTYFRRYIAEATPLSAAALNSFLGIVIE